MGDRSQLMLARRERLLLRIGPLDHRYREDICAVPRSFAFLQIGEGFVQILVGSVIDHLRWLNVRIAKRPGQDAGFARDRELLTDI